LSRKNDHILTFGSDKVLAYKDGGKLKCRLLIIDTKNGTRSVHCNIANSKRRFYDEFGSKKLYEKGQEIIETVPYEIMETIYQIDQYTKSIVKPSSEGAWVIGKLIDDFLNKFPDVAFINLSFCLTEWFKTHERVKFNNPQTWATFYNFYKSYKLEDIERVPYYYLFIENGFGGFRGYNRLLEYLHRKDKHIDFLDWYKSQSDHNIKGTELSRNAEKILRGYDNDDRWVEDVMIKKMSKKVREKVEAEY